MLSWTLTERQLGDFDLITLGACEPLQGFMDRQQYESVVRDMKLPTGDFFPMPMVLDVPGHLAKLLDRDSRLILQGASGETLGELVVSDVWRPDKSIEAQMVYGTTSVEHNGVCCLLNEFNSFYVGGTLENVKRYQRFGFGDFFITPGRMRRFIAEMGKPVVAGFHTRNPLHRAHWKICEHAIEEYGAHLILHPVIGSCQHDDVDFATRMRCYRHVMDENKDMPATLAVCPIVMRMAGPREALWHAMIRRNYGMTHFIIGRDHASPAGHTGTYATYEAQDLAEEHKEALGIEVIRAKEFVYCSQTHHFVEKEKLADTMKVEQLSGSRIRKLLRTGSHIPSWLTFPAVHEELRYRYPAGLGRGYLMFIIGEEGDLCSLAARGVREVLLEEARQGVCLCSGHYLDSLTDCGTEHSQGFFNFFAQSLIQAHGTLIFYNLLARHRALLQALPLYLWSSCLAVHLTRGGEDAAMSFGIPWKLPVIQDNFITVDVTDPHEAVKKTVDWLVELGLIEPLDDRGGSLGD